MILSFGPVEFDRDVAAFDITGFLQAIAERRQQWGETCSGAAAKIPDDGQRRLLRARYKRPSECCAAKQFDEPAPLHVASTVPPCGAPESLARCHLTTGDKSREALAFRHIRAVKPIRTIQFRPGRPREPR